MNGIPAILLVVSSAITAVSSLLSGRKRNALIFAGIGAAIAACALAAKQEKDKKELEIDVTVSEDPIEAETDAESEEESAEAPIEAVEQQTNEDA